MSIMLQQKLEAWANQLAELRKMVEQPDGQPFLARLMAVEARLSKLESGSFAGPTKAYDLAPAVAPEAPAADARQTRVKASRA